MFRSARQGRQGKRNSNKTNDHLDKTTTTKNSKQQTLASVSKKTNQTTSNSKGDRIDEHQLYDYQANSQSRGKRLTANQIDDHRLTGARPSKNDDLDQEIDDMARIDSLVERCHQENEEGFGFVNSDEDESIDSDEADGVINQPKKKVKQRGHQQKNKPKKRPNAKVRFEDNEASSVADGSEEEETDLDQDEFIDASTMLDIGAESDHAFSDEEDQMGDSDDSDRSSHSDTSQDGDIHLDELGDDDDSKLNNIANIVNNLDSLIQKRKETSQDHLADHTTDASAKRRKLLPVQIESRTEGEILPSMSTAGPSDDQASGRVNLEDLLYNLSSLPGISDLKQSLKPLITSSRSSKAGPIPAPLETRHQQQIERQAAYELTKKEMAKWDATTKLAQGLSGRNSDGKNRFVVPSNQISAADKEPDATRWNMHFNPLNDLESQVIGLIETSQLTSKKLAQEESDQLISQGILPQQLREKVLESKMARELMFRAERKAKRVAKIKSKAFRRIRKKDKQRKSISESGGKVEDMEFIQELDDIDGGDRVQTKTEEMELERARERVSLKHSNQGKWAKKVAGLKGLGSDANTAIQERIRREELLKQKIAGRQGSDGSDGCESDSSFDSDAEGDVDAIKAHALKQLGQIDSQYSSDEPRLKGLFAMKFMQNAMAAKERKAEEARMELRQHLLTDNPTGSVEEEDLSGGMKVQGNPGRLVFNPDVCRQVIDPTTADNDVTTSDHDTSTHPVPYRTTKTSGSHLQVMAISDKLPREGMASLSKPVSEKTSAEEEANPWLAVLESTAKGGTISRIKDLNPNSNKNADSVDVVAEKAKLKAEKRKRKQTSEKELATEDAKVDLDFNAFLGGKSGEVGAEALKSMQDRDEQDTEGDAVIRKGQADSQGRSAFQQRELVQQAFADDGVVAQFAEEKRQQIEKDAPKEVDVTLPGWGDWVGKGGKKAKHSKKFVKKVAGIEPSKRQDLGKSHVIILEGGSSKHNGLKKLSKYQLTDLPFPYTNQHQLDLNLSHSIGPEFNSRLAHRHLTRPDVLSRPGVVIQPVDKPV